jgi:hypothetical protein
MIFPEILGKNFFYLYERIEDFTHISTGILIKAISKNKKIAYIDFSQKPRKLTNFFENLALSKEFQATYKIKLDIFTFETGKITKSILPIVEYLSINQDGFFREIQTDYDIIIFENFQSEFITTSELIQIIQNKNPKTNIIITSSKEEILKKTINYIDKVSIIKQICSNSLISSKNVEVVCANNQENRQLNSLGEIIRNFVLKQETRYVSFLERNNDEEKSFLANLKLFSKNQTLYPNFDFVIYTNKNSNNNKLINLELYEDFLKIVITLLRKEGGVSIIDNLHNPFVQNNNIINETYKLLKEAKSKIKININRQDSHLLNLSTKTTKFDDFREFE